MIETVAAKGAELLFSYGLIGLVVIVLGFDNWLKRQEIAALHKQVEGCWTARIETKGVVTAALERSTTTGATLIASREAQVKLLEEILRSALETLRQLDTVNDRLKGIGSRVEALPTERLKEIAERIDRIIDQRGGR